ncbi:hypothetical protein PC129_g25039 [Phytophthora cactorum]|nr:hypothetical protein C6341_g27732 [Phytophthora cactorum]KAG3192588.1 hypothetical protein PC129_g25039 [Phytophthora cactorum]
MAFQQQNAAVFMDATGLPTSFDQSQTGSYVYRAADNRAAPVPTMDPNVMQEQKRKSIELALQTLAGAEEALDNADVTEFLAMKPLVRRWKASREHYADCAVSSVVNNQLL